MIRIGKTTKIEKIRTHRAYGIIRTYIPRYISCNSVVRLRQAPGRQNNCQAMQLAGLFPRKRNAAILT